MNIKFVTNNPAHHEVTLPTINYEEFKAEWFLQRSGHTLLDLETTGLHFKKNEILLVAIADYDLGTLYCLDYYSVKDDLDLYFKDSTVYGHNLGFDLPFMLERGFGFTQSGIYDTMVVEQCLVKGTMESVSLQNTIKRRLGHSPLDKMIRNEFPLMTASSAVFADRHITYACEDLVYLPEIIEVQNTFIEKYKLRELVNLNNETVYVVAKMRVWGMPVDRNEWMELYYKNINRADALEIELDNELTKIGLKQRKRKKVRTVQTSFVDEGYDVVNKNIGNINYGSSSQLLDIFYTLELPRPTKSREDTESMGEASIRQYMIEHKKSPLIPFLEKLLDYKDMSKRANTFGKKWIDKFLEEDGVVRANFKINSTHTGRFACSDPNLQQIPAVTDFRHCFKAREGYLIWTADYASAELRIMASLSGDVVMLDLLSRGADLHGYAATKVYRYLHNDPEAVVDKKNHTEFRTAMKNVIFGLSYGAGVSKIAELLDISKGRAEAVYNLLSDIFPQAFAMLERNAIFGSTNGYIVFDNILNQRRWFPELLAKNRTGANVSAAQRASKNSPIQGVNGQMVKKALCDLNNFIETMDLKTKIVSTVHDEIVLEVPVDEQVYGDSFALIMKDAGSYFLSGIEMGVDWKFSESWSK